MTVAVRNRVLVLDADMVPALTIARSLRRRDCIVDVASHTPKPLASYSRSINRCFNYPDPLAASASFVQWLLEHVEREHYDLVVPVTERTLVALSAERERLRHINIAMPAASSLEVVLDKSQTLALADELGVPRPFGVSLASLDELPTIEPTLKYPVVLKPARSIGSADGGASQLQVSYAFDAMELEAGCAHALRFGPVLLQGFFSGAGVGIELIARHGKIVYAFQHLRLHEVPLTGGGSSLRKSEQVLPVLLDASERMIRALNWHGVAMVEFKYNAQTRDFCLMEINGRFWGSLPLATAAGADFPAMLLDLALDRQIAISQPYRENIYCRLLSRDLGWYEAILRGGADTRIASIPRPWEVIKELTLFFSLRHRFDVQSLRDPLPGIVDVGRIARSYIDRLRSLAAEQKFRLSQRHAWKSGKVSAAVLSAQSMLFLCYGNINRSALADVMIRAYAEDSGLSVTSAGFHPEGGRRADPIMVDVASQFGVNLQHERSTCVTPHMLRTSDIIFVMEKTHYDRLVRMDENLSSKIYLMGAHPGRVGNSGEIADPYGQPRGRYIQCFNQVADAVDSIKGLLAERVPD